MSAIRSGDHQNERLADNRPSIKGPLSRIDETAPRLDPSPPSDPHFSQTEGTQMAGGWARDGAVAEQIDASIADELARLHAQRRPLQGDSFTHCAECEEPIPEPRRAALPGVKLCIDCQQARDAAPRARGGINRRGSKDSQLK